MRNDVTNFFLRLLKEVGYVYRRIYTNQIQTHMLSPNDEHLFKDLRFWVAILLLGALLSFMIFTYPGM